MVLIKKLYQLFPAFFPTTIVVIDSKLVSYFTSKNIIAFVFATRMSDDYSFHVFSTVSIKF